MREQPLRMAPVGTDVALTRTTRTVYAGHVKGRQLFGREWGRVAKILLVDNDAYLADLLCYALAREGFDIAAANTGREALRLVQAEGTDLVILDVAMPDMDGFRLLAALRAVSQAPVVVLTDRSRDEDVIAGFENGADDYVVKPFNMQVLVNRVKAVLRRTGARPAQPQSGAHTYRVGSAVFDPAAYDLLSPTMTVHLTPTEGRVLGLLLMHEGQAFSAERILEHIRGYNTSSSASVIKTHIRHLREKIALLPDRPQPIRTLPGLGYAAHQIDENGETLAQADSTQRAPGGAPAHLQPAALRIPFRAIRP